ncbi:MAG TPA: hypothetical protein VNM67_20685 [Thermoanaerobaculia bacterium]|jgi:hypothetical protein|nr:hypothetical protein [Thermoanaerobaculia bacterium]
MDKPSPKEESRNDVQEFSENDPTKNPVTKGEDRPARQRDIDVPKVPSAYPAEGAD